MEKGKPSINPTRFLYVLKSGDRKSTRLNSSHSQISYAGFCLKKKSHAALRGFLPRIVPNRRGCWCLAPAKLLDTDRSNVHRPYESSLGTANPSRARRNPCCLK